MMTLKWERSRVDYLGQIGALPTTIRAVALAIYVVALKHRHRNVILGLYISGPTRMRKMYFIAIRKAPDDTLYVTKGDQGCAAE